MTELDWKIKVIGGRGVELQQEVREGVSHRGLVLIFLGLVLVLT